MDPLGFNPDAPREGDALGSRAGARRESVTDGQPEIRNGNGVGAVTLRSPPGLGEIAPAEAAYKDGHGPVARAIKRGFDLIGALLLLVLLAPLLLVIALVIKADSPGPILFRQRRIGHDGKPFWMLKFRTMVDGADAHKPALLHLNDAGHGLFKINTDPRVTRFGRWLRGTCLDELPQLLHVITGPMSLVGPRPLVPEEDVQITGRDRRRLSMRPGITGVWQVGGASRIPIDDMVVLDRDYVENWSPWLDLRLLAETAAIVILRKGI